MTTQITIVGNLVDDPELRFTPSGVAVVKFRVAVNRRQYDKAAGEWTDAGTDYHTVSAWRHLAEHSAETLRKGMRVIVVGGLSQRSWEGKDGEKRYAWEVTASAVGPDLAYAIAKVAKSTSNRNSDTADDVWSSASPN